MPASATLTRPLPLEVLTEDAFTCKQIPKFAEVPEGSGQPLPPLRGGRERLRRESTLIPRGSPGAPGARGAAGAVALPMR